ncbi:MAG TPA: hypothetical protein VF972_00470 [Actinomycetota bacterium]
MAKRMVLVLAVAGTLLSVFASQANATIYLCSDRTNGSVTVERTTVDGGATLNMFAGFDRFSRYRFTSFTFSAAKLLRTPVFVGRLTAFSRGEVATTNMTFRIVAYRLGPTFEIYGLSLLPCTTTLTAFLRLIGSGPTFELRGVTIFNMPGPTLPYAVPGMRLAPGAAQRQREAMALLQGMASPSE